MLWGLYSSVIHIDCLRVQALIILIGYYLWGITISTWDTSVNKTGKNIEVSEGFLHNSSKKSWIGIKYIVLKEGNLIFSYSLCDIFFIWTCLRGGMPLSVHWDFVAWQVLRCLKVQCTWICLCTWVHGCCDVLGLQPMSLPEVLFYSAKTFCQRCCVNMHF
jgi:hypothetical protein